MPSVEMITVRTTAKAAYETSVDSEWRRGACECTKQANEQVLNSRYSAGLHAAREGHGARASGATRMVRFHAETRGRRRESEAAPRRLLWLVAHRAQPP